MFHYADTDREHILRCIQNHIFYDFHRDMVILLDKRGRLHQGNLNAILGNQDILKRLSSDARDALYEEYRRNNPEEESLEVALQE